MIAFDIPLNTASIHKNFSRAAKWREFHNRKFICRMSVNFFAVLLKPIETPK